MPPSIEIGDPVWERLRVQLGRLTTEVQISVGALVFAHTMRVEDARLGRAA